MGCLSFGGIFFTLLLVLFVANLLRSASRRYDRGKHVPLTERWNGPEGPTCYQCHGIGGDEWRRQGSACQTCGRELTY